MPCGSFIYSYALGAGCVSIIERHSLGALFPLMQYAECYLGLKTRWLIAVSIA